MFIRLLKIIEAKTTLGGKRETYTGKLIVKEILDFFS